MHLLPGVGQLLLVLLLHLRRHLLLVTRVDEDLLLLLDARLGLVQLLLRLGDFGVDVDAALDVKEDGSGSRDGVGNTTCGSGGIGFQDLDILDCLATERLDRSDLLLASLQRSLVEGLDDDCFIELASFIATYITCYLPSASSLSEYSAMSERAALVHPSTSSYAASDSGSSRAAS